MIAPDPQALECLAAIVEEGGFERAAARLAVSQSAVSQRLRALEEQVGAVLIERSRPLQATPAARLLLRHAAQLRLLRADLAAAWQALTQTPLAAGQARIAVAVNADSLATWALPAFDALVQQGLALELIADDQDFTVEWLRQGRVVACVTTLAAALRGCRVVALGAMPYVAVASPAWLARHPDRSPHTWLNWPFIAFNRKDDLQADFVAHLCGLGRVRLQHLYVPSSQGQLHAVRSGWGASVLPQALVQGDLAGGELVDLAEGQRWRVPLYWHSWKLHSVVLEALQTAVCAAAQAALEPLDASAHHDPEHF